VASEPRSVWGPGVVLRVSETRNENGPARPIRIRILLARFNHVENARTAVGKRGLDWLLRDAENAASRSDSEALIV
jgi:hypothetical protein